MLTVLIGGARSGKSTLALELVKEAGEAVTFIATAEARDDEMRARIAAHRASRPSSWTTREEPCALDTVVLGLAEDQAMIIDCLTLWVANLIERGDDDETIAALAQRAAALVKSRRASCVVVSNEVGAGLVPMDPVGRRYRDLLGQVNALFAAAADRTFLVVAGQVILLGAFSEQNRNWSP